MLYVYYRHPYIVYVLTKLLGVYYCVGRASEVIFFFFFTALYYIILSYAHLSYTRVMLWYCVRNRRVYSGRITVKSYRVYYQVRCEYLTRELRRRYTICSQWTCVIFKSSANVLVLICRPISSYRIPGNHRRRVLVRVSVNR